MPGFYSARSRTVLPSSRGVILADLRQIVTGSAKPGSRFAQPRGVCREEFGASTATVQQAFNTLIEDEASSTSAACGARTFPRGRRTCAITGLCSSMGWKARSFGPRCAKKRCASHSRRNAMCRSTTTKCQCAAGVKPSDERRLLSRRHPAQRLAGLVFVQSLLHSWRGRPAHRARHRQVALDGESRTSCPADDRFVESCARRGTARGRRR